MPVMKRDNAAVATGRALVLDLGDLDRQAQRIIADARTEAERIVEAARAEAQTLIDAADARGYAEGRTRGEAEGRTAGAEEGREAAAREHGERFEQLAASWTEALERWEADLGGLLVAARQEVLEFAVALARKIVRRVTTVDPSVVEDQVAGVLALVGRASSVTVVVNPDDRPAIERVLPELLERFAGCRYASIETDEGIARGGCVVRTAGGAIDATIDTQLERVAATLLPRGPASGGGAS